MNQGLHVISIFETRVVDLVKDSQSKKFVHDLVNFTNNELSLKYKNLRSKKHDEPLKFEALLVDDIQDVNITYA